MDHPPEVFNAYLSELKAFDDRDRPKATTSSQGASSQAEESTAAEPQLGPSPPAVPQSGRSPAKSASSSKVGIQ